MLRSIAQQCVSKHKAAPSFETRPAGAPQDEAEIPSAIATARRAKVGTQYVATVHHSKAVLHDIGAPQNVRFICLHGGLGKGAVFFYTLPLN